MESPSQAMPDPICPCHPAPPLVRILRNLLRCSLTTWCALNIYFSPKRAGTPQRYRAQCPIAFHTPALLGSAKQSQAGCGSGITRSWSASNRPLWKPCARVTGMQTFGPHPQSAKTMFAHSVLSTHVHYIACIIIFLFQSEMQVH